MGRYDQLQTRDHTPQPAPRLRSAALATGLLALVAACGGSTAGFSDPGTAPGTNPSDGTRFFEDSNQGGEGSSISLDRMYWGRLVDVFGTELVPVTEDELAALDPSELITLDAADCPDDPSSPTACLRRKVSVLQHEDFVVGQSITTDGVNYLLETNSVTQVTRLTIPHPDFSSSDPLADVEDPNDPDDLFSQLLRSAENAVIEVPRVGLNEAGPYPLIARNAVLGLQFSDLLDHETIRSSTVRVLVGDPPELPFEARIVPDSNHGGLANGAFHTTRILVDMTVSELESAALAASLPTNSLGLPISQNQVDANLALEFPSFTAPSLGVFRRLQNLRGSGMSLQGNGEIDTTRETMPVRRVLRTGNSDDQNGGFLLDLRAPQVVGSQPVRVRPQDLECAEGEERLTFVVNIEFDFVACARRPRAGDVINLPIGLVEVAEDGVQPTGGTVFSVLVNLLGEVPVCPLALDDEGSYLSTYSPQNNDRAECFVSISPTPNLPPNNGVDPDSVVTVRFSEPMNSSTVDPFESFLVTRVPEDPVPLEVVIGSMRASSDLQRFSFLPTLDLTHEQGSAEEYFFTLSNDALLGVTDLAGNGLQDSLPQVSFTLDPEAVERRTGGYTLRFNSIDEDNNGDAGNTRPEIRGQFLFDFEGAALTPRAVNRFRAVADRTQAVPSLMVPFAPGVQTPLTPLGSKLMSLWRFFDVGFSLLDENTYNVDIEGLNWAPVNGTLQADFYERFSIAVAHSGRAPDEYINPASLLPMYAQSGLRTSSFNLAGINRLDDPFNDLTEMVPAERGYVFSPADAFQTATGTVMVPYPINNSQLQVDPAADPLADYRTYTWRDTSILGVDGSESGGMFPEIFLTAGLLPGGEDPGARYGAGFVPSIALPLLIQYSCFPSDEGSGLNAFDISLAVNSSARPYFRIFSTGGTNSQGDPVEVDPESEFHQVPRGAFNPSNEGAMTPPADNSFYIGAMDVVIRISRAHTIWFGAPDSPKSYETPVIFPTLAQQPFGTSIVLQHRGATSITDGLEFGSVDASIMSAYGDSTRVDNPNMPGQLVEAFEVEYLDGVESWADTISDLNTASYIQTRITFISNVQSGESPVLSALGIPFTR